MLQVGLLNENTHLIITNLDLHTIDLEPFRHIGANITGFRLTDGKNQYLNGLSEYMNDVMKGQYDDRLLSDSILLHDAAIFDGILLYAEAVKKLDDKFLNSNNLNCTGESTYTNGFSISNYIKLVNNYSKLFN